MTFSQDILAWIQKVERKEAALRNGVDAECFRSIVDGSAITASPGQPVHTGKLKASWKMERSGDETTIASDAPYAQAVEENWGDVVYHTGGPHSVALTLNGFGNIVDSVTARVGDAG